MKITVHFVLIVFFATPYLQSQTAPNGHFCATNFRAQTPYHKAANLKTDFPKSNTTLYIPVTANFIGTDSGTGYYLLEDFLEELCKLNTDFAPHDFHFYLENIVYINRSEFYQMDPDTFVFEQPMYQFIENHNTLNTMNVYIVRQAGGWSFVTWDEIEEVDYSVYPPINIYSQNQCVVLDRDHLNQSNTFTHEVGHYFALWHTFWGDWDTFAIIGTPTVWNYEVIEIVSDTIYTVVPWLVERVDGIECDISGDLICDTPPDYLGGFFCNANQESNIVQTDPVDSTFRSNGSYYMSYSNDGCQDKFSPMQVDVMRNVAQGGRNYLLYDQTAPTDYTIDDLSLIFPPDGAEVATSDFISFEWEMPGIDFYILDIGRKQNNLHIPLESNILLNENQYEFEIQNPVWEYYWIVRGVSKYHPCEMWADTSYFTIGSVSTFESIQTERLELYPNPATNQLYLHFNDPLMNDRPMEAEILDANGKVIDRQIVSAKKISVDELAQGLYILKISDGERVYIEKFIKD